MKRSRADRLPLQKLGLCLATCLLFSEAAYAGPPWSIAIEQQDLQTSGGFIACSELACRGDISLEVEGQTRIVHVQAFLDVLQSAAKLAFADGGLPPRPLEFTQSHPLRVGVGIDGTGRATTVLRETLENDPNVDSAVNDLVYRLGPRLALLTIRVKVLRGAVTP